MKPECKVEASNKFLEDKRTIRLTNKLQRSIAYRLPNELIGDDPREEIREAKTTTVAMEIFRVALKNSEDPQKIPALLTELESSEPLHAKKLKEVFQEHLDKHDCPECTKPETLPEVPTHDPVADEGLDDSLKYSQECTSSNECTKT